jgi:type IV secretory pathway VirD2 relaxase
MAKSKSSKPSKPDRPEQPMQDSGDYKFRLRPRRGRPAARGDIGWSIALRTIFRYARSSAKSRKHRQASSAGPRPRRSLNQRCAVRVTYSQNKIAGQWRAHGIYIARESAAGKQEHAGFAASESGKDIAATLDKWQAAGDERIWKIILSPEFGERLDLERMTRDALARSEKQLGTSLEWVAVSHFNTEHPHVHLVIRGRREDGSPLTLPRDFIKQGMRNLAEDACTLQLGPRTELDALAASEREAKEHRFTSLDRALERRGSREHEEGAEHLRVTVDPRLVNNPVASPARERLLQARLTVLQGMGLAYPAAPGEWLVRANFSTVLKAMQLAQDRQKMLARSGGLLSDPRLRLNVLDFRRTPEVQGRVLVHGEEEQALGAERHYLLLEGTDAQVHMIFYTPEMEEARSAGRLKPNSFVQMRIKGSGRGRILQVIDLGDATSILRNKPFLRSSVQRLLRQGVIPIEEGWGGWLGQYQSEISKATKDPGRSRRHSQER